MEVERVDDPKVQTKALLHFFTTGTDYVLFHPPEEMVSLYEWALSSREAMHQFDCGNGLPSLRFPNLQISVQNIPVPFKESSGEKK